MKPRIKRYMCGHSALAWECRGNFEAAYGDTPKAAYDNWGKKRRGLQNAAADPYRRKLKFDPWGWL